MIEEKLTEQIIGAAIEVHKHWGPGLYEEFTRRVCVMSFVSEIYSSRIK